MPLNRSALLESLFVHYPMRDEHGIHLRERILDVCDDFIKFGLADPDTEEKLCSQDSFKHWQQFSEVLLAHQLWKAGFAPTRLPEGGPDFLIESDGRKIWIEVITPEPVGMPPEWQNRPFKGGRFPHEAIVLRWTHAIKEKAEKLLGNSKKSGYLKDGLVGPHDSYVIAVNGYLLRSPIWIPLDSDGISGWTFAVEATFCVGARELRIDKLEKKVVGSGHQYRPLIDKPDRKPVPADTFLDPRFAPVSAIWAVDIDAALLLGFPRPMTVIHNPEATNAIPDRWLPAYSEVVAAKDYLERRPGRLQWRDKMVSGRRN